MQEPHESDLIREATAIFLRLRDAPEDTDLQAERDRFLARGPEARAAYAKMLRAWQITETRPGPNRNIVPVLLVAMGLTAGGVVAYDPLRIALTADLATGVTTRTAALASGDRVVLDAESALIDDTDEGARAVTVMRGAAFFDVETTGRPFVVTAGALRVDVTGTAFEVGYLGNGGQVTVTEGSVEVTLRDQAWRLSPGDQFRWFGDAQPEVAQVTVETSVSWRRDQLVADVMPLSEIAEILGRRLPGSVIVLGSDLGREPIVGTFDLGDPTGSLALLVELTGATALRIPGIGTILRR
ncbi:MAG: FecR domain-containing protein [Pseudomonadota bacterium]